MSDFSPGEVRTHLERAGKALEAADTLCDAGLFDDAASRAYYAAFHAASAALASRGLTFRKHGAVIGAVHKWFVRTGEVEAETGKWLTWLFELRSVGDYGEMVHVNEEQARMACERATTLVRIFQKLLRHQ